MGDYPTEVFTPKEAEKFRMRFPRIEITGRGGDLYKCHDVLNYIKETSNNCYADINILQNNLIKALNIKHLAYSGRGNMDLNGGQRAMEEIYTHRITSNYVNVRCNISKKCRFAMWYKFDRSSNDEPINIRWFRTINNNHDLLYHKEAGIY